jgi:hypothetical protein
MTEQTTNQEPEEPSNTNSESIDKSTKTEPDLPERIEIEKTKIEQAKVQEKIKGEDVRLQLEKQRGLIAIILIGCYAVSLVGFGYLATTDKVNNTSTRELITLFWTSQVGLVSSVIGYYFGAASKESK